MGALAIDFTGRLLLATGGFGKHVLQGVVRIAGIGVEYAARRQIHGHGPQARDVGLAAGVYIKLDWQAVAGSDNLHLETVKPAALAGTPAVIGLAGQEFAARDTGIVADGDRKRVNEVAGLGV